MSDRFKLRGLRQLLFRPQDRGHPDAAAARARAMYLPPEGLVTKRRDSVVEFLGKVGLFEGLGRGDRLRLSRILHERDYADGDYICEKGRPGAALFIVRRGVVEVVTGDSAGEVPLVLLEPPASFEESAAIEASAIRWFSVRARGPVSLLALGRSDLDTLASSFPVLANKVLVRLAAILAVRVQMRIEAEVLGAPDKSEKAQP